MHSMSRRRIPASLLDILISYAELASTDPMLAQSLAKLQRCRTGQRWQPVGDIVATFRIGQELGVHMGRNISGEGNLPSLRFCVE